MVETIHAELGIPDTYAETSGLPHYAEPGALVSAGPNIVGREQQLTPVTVAAWVAMVDAAAADDVRLLLVSGFRSIDQQTRLIRKKLNAGQTIDQILRVNAAPGFSQHHTGCAIDIATPGVRPLMLEFEETPAFAWLQTHTHSFGFSLSYPRDNPWGIDYEPWHWFYQENDA